MPEPVIDRVALQLGAVFTDGRVLAAKGSRITASVFVKGERLATNNLHFFKRATDLGINVDDVGTGNAANDVTRFVNVCGIVVRRGLMEPTMTINDFHAALQKRCSGHSQPTTTR